MNPDETIKRAAEARSVLSNVAFNEMLEIVGAEIDARIDAMPTTEVDKCLDLIRTRQIFTRVKQSLRRMVDDGTMVEKELDFIARRNRKKVFRR